MTRRTRTTTKAELNRNKTRQAYMKVAGYNVPQDGSWGPWQQSIWNKLTTRPKEYDTTLMGLKDAIVDKITGNDTERFNPLAQGSLTSYNPKNVDWGKTRRSQNKVVNAVSGTWGPLVAAASAPALVRSMVTAPIATMATMAGGAAGGYAVDKTSETLTGRDLGTNAAMYTPLTPGLVEIFNPGYYLVAGAFPRALAGTDVAITALTGKSRDWMKPLVNDYIGKAYYNNIRPSGYGNNDPFAKSRFEQLGDMAVDIMKPHFLRKGINNPNYRPAWFKDKDNSTVFEVFRNDAHRLSMGLEPHKELLPDGKMHSLYIKKSNGNYDVDWDYIRHIKQNYSDTDGRAKLYMPTDFPTDMEYIAGTSPTNGRVVANDRITMNGGFGSYILNPNKVYETGPISNVFSKMPTHFSTGDVTFMDTWDVQPLIDERSFAPWLTKSLTRIENKNFPILSKAASSVKNIELVDALGGTPFIQESKLPEQNIYWYAPKMTLAEQYAKNSRNFETLNY